MPSGEAIKESPRIFSALQYGKRPETGLLVVTAIEVELIIANGVGGVCCRGWFFETSR